MSLDMKDLLGKKFPESITQGLHKLEQILKMPSTPQLHKVQQEIIEKSIFNLQDSTSVSKSIEPIEELVIVRAIAQHLAQIIDPALRNSVFITLFPTVINDQCCFRVLSSLVSLAVATHNISVLDATAVWMQQVSCLSSRCIQVCQGLIQDYFKKKDDSPVHFTKALKALPSATPLFMANLITVLAQVYAKLETKEFCDEPPHYLVDMFLHWLKNNPLLTLTPLTTTLPGISLPMVAVTPIAPIAKWCVEAPYFCDERENMKIDAFSELHLILLQTIQNVPSIRSKMTQREVICAEHLKNIAEVLTLRITTKSPLDSHNALALERLAQITLVALQTECLSGRLAEMWNAFKKLPTESRLMKMLFSFSPCQ